MAGAYGFDSSHRWSAVKNIATGDGDTTIAAGVTGKVMRVQGLCVVITTAAAQTFDIEDTGSSPVEIFKAVTSQAVGSYILDFGPLGIAMSATGAGLEYDCSAAGVSATISCFGYFTEGA
jgi:hypothetical protein